MKDKVDFFVEAGNIKFRTSFRDSVYKVIESRDQSGLFNGPTLIFYVAFSIGYHFNKQMLIGRGAINHVNLVSMDRGIKELMAQLILKRKPQVKESKELWEEVEKYAEYGIQVLHNSLTENSSSLDILSILEKSAE